MSTIGRVRFCVTETLANALIIIMLVCGIFLACATSSNLASAALFCVTTSLWYLPWLYFFVCLFVYFFAQVAVLVGA